MYDNVFQSVWDYSGPVLDHNPHKLGGFLKDFLGFENMGDRGWTGNALFGPWGGVPWAQLRYAGDGDCQFAWGSHEKAEKCDRV